MLYLGKFECIFLKTVTTKLFHFLNSVQQGICGSVHLCMCVCVCVGTCVLVCVSSVTYQLTYCFFLSIASDLFSIRIKCHIQITEICYAWINFINIFLFLFSVCGSLCYVHHLKQLWEELPFVNRAWCIVVPLL